jgi:hypothetical protein
LQYHHRKKLNQLNVSLLLFSTCFFYPSIVSSQPTDWTVTISTQRLDTYLGYVGSPLAPIIRTTIYCNQADQSIHYEDLYYSNGQAIGCRRFHSLGPTPGTAGVIAINLSSNDQPQSCAAANAAIRAYLDLYLQKSAVKKITISAASVDNLIQGLQQCGFQPFEIVPDKPFKAKIVLEVYSIETGRIQYLFYDDSN